MIKNYAANVLPLGPTPTHACRSLVTSDEITLHQITTGLTAAEKVDPRLDAFGYDAAAEFMGKLGDGTHE